MNEDQKNTTFQYTYSAREQEELRRIRNKYLHKEENKMELLRKLDAQVTQKATMYSIIVGVIGALILGVGMSCCMVWADSVFVLGIVIGVIGMGILGMSRPRHLLCVAIQDSTFAKSKDVFKNWKIVDLRLATQG